MAQRGVNIVADEENAPGHCHTNHSGQRFLIQHRSRGVVGGVEDDGPGFFGDFFPEGLQTDLEAGFLQRKEHRLRPQAQDDGFIQGKGGGGNDHLISGIEDPGKGSVQSAGGADGDEHLFRGTSHSTVDFIIGNGFPQGIGATVGGVVGQAVSKGLRCRLPDGQGRVKIRLADGEHFAPRGCFGQGGEAADAAGDQVVKIVIHGNSSASRSK